MTTQPQDTPTPRTDERCNGIHPSELLKHPVREVSDMADFARQLERDLADRTQEVERLTRELTTLRTTPAPEKVREVIERYLSGPGYLRDSIVTLQESDKLFNLVSPFLAAQTTLRKAAEGNEQRALLAATQMAVDYKAQTALVAELTQEVERLTREREELNGKLATANFDNKELLDDIGPLRAARDERNQLRAALAEAKRDWERLEWLFNYLWSHHQHIMTGFRYCRLVDKLGNIVGPVGDRGDVDAAMQADAGRKSP